MEIRADTIRSSADPPSSPRPCPLAWIRWAHVTQPEKLVREQRVMEFRAVAQPTSKLLLMRSSLSFFI
jgi:hypothetical protein